jgi:hypothetical protein
VLNDKELKKKILDEARKSWYTIHPKKTKMYQDLKKVFWWPGMKKDVTKYVHVCLACQKMKVKHKKSVSLLQPLSIPQWKWECVTIDFVCSLPMSGNKKDVVWVIMYRLTKTAHFIPVNMDYLLEKLAPLYIQEIVCLHGVPLSIVSERGPRFTSKFLGKFKKSLGLDLNFNTSAHPLTNEQSERVIQILDDTLTACVLDFGNE